MGRWLLPVYAGVLSVASCDAGSTLEVSGAVQAMRAGRDREGNVFVGMDIVVSDAHGESVACADGELKVDVQATVKGTGASYAVPAADLALRCAGHSSDVAIVVDNSGSENGSLSLIQDASETLAHSVMDAGGRVSLTRVSTNASVQAELGRDREKFDAALADLSVANGWTALYDGVRMANETLGGGQRRDPRKDRYPDAAAFCEATEKLAIVAVTDGGDNNSAGEKLRSEGDDGLDTTLEDLHKLNVLGVTTPIYAVGIGNRVEHEKLSELAAHMGGKYVPVDSARDVPAVFAALSEYAEQSHKVCATLPQPACGEIQLDVSFTFKPPRGRTIRGSRQETVYVECDVEPLAGRSATVVLTLSNPGLDREVARGIIARTVDWVSPTSNPRVLVVLDDNHHGEYRGDADFIVSELMEQGYRVQRLDEPVRGLALDQLSGVDVVWFTNPGYPVDDEASMRTLNDFLRGSGGVVLSGDDITQAWGNAFSMEPYTHLQFVNNGTSFCGHHTDNNRGDAYRVQFTTGSHPIVQGIEGFAFSYGDDIDRASVSGAGEQVLASASIDPACGELPVIVSFEP